MGELRNPSDGAIASAIYWAMQSPCAKSQRGAVAMEGGGGIGAIGYNAPALGKCDGTDACRRHCSKRCEHAEAACMRRLHHTGTRPVEIVHVKLVDGGLVHSGPPSCWQCSKAVVAHPQVTAVWLFHADGWRRYGDEEFHMLTLEHCGIDHVE